jgi:hypothetical protein
VRRGGFVSHNDDGRTLIAYLCDDPKVVKVQALWRRRARGMKSSWPIRVTRSVAATHRPRGGALRGSWIAHFAHEHAPRSEYGLGRKRSDRRRDACDRRGKKLHGRHDANRPEPSGTRCCVVGDRRPVARPPRLFGGRSWTTATSRSRSQLSMPITDLLMGPGLDRAPQLSPAAESRRVLPQLAEEAHHVLQPSELVRRRRYFSSFPFGPPERGRQCCCINRCSPSQAQGRRRPLHDQHGVWPLVGWASPGPETGSVGPPTARRRPRPWRQGQPVSSRRCRPMSPCRTSRPQASPCGPSRRPSAPSRPFRPRVHS